MELTPDHIETIKCLIEDWGFEYGLKAERSNVRALAQVVGMDPKKVRDILGFFLPESAPIS